MSIRLTRVLALSCSLLLACQSRTILTEAPRTQTPTVQPLIAASPASASSAARPVVGPAVTFATAIATPPSPPSSGQAAAAASPPAVAGSPSPPPVAAAPSPTPCPYAPTRRLAGVQDRALREASALAASQRWPGIYWALNDSGNAPSVFAVDDRGRSRGTFRVEDAQNVDWEALQVGPGRDGGTALYIGDIGDNDRERREVIIYRVPEPEPFQAGARNPNGRTADAEVFKLQYPNGARDAEGLLVHPQTGEILVFSKEEFGRTTVYRVPTPLDSRRTVRLERVGDVDMSRVGVKIDLVTDTTVSADARRVAIRTYGSALEYDVPPGATLASIWGQTPRVAPLDDGPQGEGITYRADGGALITIGESSPTFLYETARTC